MHLESFKIVLPIILQSISTFSDRVRVNMSNYSSNYLATPSRITVVNKQPKGHCLVPKTSQLITLMAQFMVLMIHGDIPTIPVCSPKDPGFILV
jgi:hypothetical protein